MSIPKGRPAITTVSTLVLLLALAFAQHLSQATAQQSHAGAVTVSGKALLLDGSPFIAKGVIFQAFVEVQSQLESCSKSVEYCSRHIEARDFYFGRGKYQVRSGLAVAREWGVNTIRLNVNQAALDPENAAFSPGYGDELSQAVALARSQGFVVILALFDARNRNAPEQLRKLNPMTPIDNDVTMRAATFLAKKFGGDKAVMLELLNEPFSPTGRKRGWLIWRDGGTVSRGKYAGYNFVGVNAVIKAIRSQGASNVIILQGLRANFVGFPGGIEDPLDQVAYSVHPFFGAGDGKSIDWDGRFGAFAESHPFLISAWGTNQKTDWCDKLGVQKPRQFLQYLQSKKIGLVAYAMDVPFKLLTDFRDSNAMPTRFESKCTKTGAPGELVRDFFSGRLEAK